MDLGWAFIGVVVVIVIVAAAAVVAFAAATGWRPARRASIAEKALAEIWPDPIGTVRSGRRTSRRPAAQMHQYRPQRLRSGPGNYSRASNTR
jgi:hypothetical protein